MILPQRELIRKTKIKVEYYISAKSCLKYSGDFNNREP